MSILQTPEFKVGPESLNPGYSSRIATYLRDSSLRPEGQGYINEGGCFRLRGFSLPGGRIALVDVALAGRRGSVSFRNGQVLFLPYDSRTSLRTAIPEENLREIALTKKNVAVGSSGFLLSINGVGEADVALHAMMIPRENRLDDLLTRAQSGEDPGQGYYWDRGGFARVPASLIGRQFDLIILESIISTELGRSRDMLVWDPSGEQYVPRRIEFPLSPKRWEQ